MPRKHTPTGPPILDANEVAPLVLDSLRAGTSLSAVRMSDGEYAILNYCKQYHPTALMQRFEPEWLEKFGCSGISCGVMQQRLALAASRCTMFAPDGCFGNHFSDFYPFRDVLYFHGCTFYRWTKAEKQAMFDAAERVLVINRDPDVAQQMRDPQFTKADVIHLRLNSWRDSENVRESAAGIKAPLVLVSGGPANKYIIPALAAARVVLDLGQAAPHWWKVFA